MSKIKLGLTYRIIGGVDGLNIGKIVIAGHYQGEHSQYGPIYRCTVTRGTELVSEYGGVGISADFAEDWLEEIPPEPLSVIERESIAA